MKTHSESMTSTYKAQLDQFIETNYNKLLEYAAFQMQNDTEAGRELLNDAVLEIYEGRRKIDFSKSPLIYFQIILHDMKTYRLTNRQEAFENGVCVKEKDGVVEFTNARESEDVLYEHGEISEVVTQLHQEKCLEAFNKLKPTLTKRRQWILDRIMEGKSYAQIHQEYNATTGLNVKLHSLRTDIAMLTREIGKKVRVLLRDDPSSDLGHRR